ncbi:c-type cytochrome [Roseivirga misakiensis]|uniref:c-type cytochrome n=1 Tax=Roseivirga misakiensis TaxID=1563681 RepID=UPI000A7B5CDE|nr:c-type cytochrome [Roseivirga misakiensis]
MKPLHFFNSKRTNSTFFTCLLAISLFLFGGCQLQDKEKPFLTGDGMGINDATLMVKDLESAIKYYKDTLGFTIYGNGTAGTFDESVSASVSLGDMSSFQIMSISDSADQQKVPQFIGDYLASNQGVRLFSVSSSSVDSTFSSLTAQGYAMDSAVSYRTNSQPAQGWSRDDGDPQRRSLDFNRSSPPQNLPRFIQNTNSNYAELLDDWNTWYVYTRMFSNHANGVVGISALKMAVNDLEASTDQYTNMGFEEVEQNDQLTKYSLFDNQELHLVSSISNPKALDFISNQGEGIYAIQFDVVNLDSTFNYFEKELPEDAIIRDTDRITIPAEYALGVQLEFVAEPEAQAILARTLMPSQELDTLAIKHAGELYTKYCALCHGDERQGYAADNAPSLRSKSLLATSMNNNFMRYTIQFGRANTAMAGYLKAQGGPLDYIEIELLLEYLKQTAGVTEAIDVSREPVIGDIPRGEGLYNQNCATCHGVKGEGVSAPALANPMLLATATDHFLRYAIAEGRDGTPMIAFKDSLSDNDIDALTAFLRTRASGWDIPRLDTVRVPTPDEYILNPDSEAPEFKLRAGRYVSAEQVNQALADGKRMVILDARSEVAWRQMHIPGAAPVPYYEDPENFIDDIPNDGTQIVIYCACPHAASERVQSTLKRYGYENTAIIDEGILVWAQMGFPVRNGT